MTIKDIITGASTFLSQSNVVDYLQNQTSANVETLNTVNTMTSLTNLIISEIASGFVFMYKEEQITPTDNRIYYTDLSERILEVVEVLGANDISLNFSVKGEYVEFYGDAKKIKYKYLPSQYGLEDTIGYTEKEISLSTLSYGLCAEYCITQSRFDEAIMWRNRFVKAISNRMQPKNVVIKERSWL